FWSIAKGECRYVVNDLKDSISCCCYDKRSNKLAVATDGLDVFVYDGSNAKIIRKFDHKKYGSSHITCLVFSPGTHWLLSSSMDGCVRVFDLASQMLIDWFQFQNAVVSMAFSPTNTFLATIHVNTMGIYIWANKAHFETPFLVPVGDKPIQMDKLPVLSSGGNENKTIEEELQSNPLVEEQLALLKNATAKDDLSSSSDDNLNDSDLQNNDNVDITIVDDNDDDDDVIDLPTEKELIHDLIHKTQLNETNNCVTTSVNPHSKWINLANWDLILERNKPSQKVKHKAQTPFFLPTITTPGQLHFDTSQTLEELQKQKLAEENQQKAKELEKRKKILEDIDQNILKPRQYDKIPRIF
ncbi:hypothetical protein RFI_21586, partial [Reticulomyxa filosa]